ncbi:MAG: NUDIX domain-containing protein [bacterium]|nr:NUDIX domain-containing protein [bacterium]
MVRRWEKRSSKILGEYPVFRLREDVIVSPRNAYELKAYILETHNWITVLPITADRRVVLVKQYRFGFEGVTLEAPGGLVDPTDESMEAAARRELAEETGCEAESMIELGVVLPNPAIQNNRCYLYYAHNVVQKFEQTLDAGEDIAIELVAFDDIPNLIANGTIQHSIVLNALYLYDLKRRAGEIQ